MMIMTKRLQKLLCLRYLILPVLLSGLMITGCEDLLDELEGNGNGDGEVSVQASFTVEPSVADPGDEVILDASDSEAIGVSDLSYSWSLNTPAGSEAQINDSNAEITSFTVDAEGAYEVTLEVSAADAQDATSDNVYVGIAGMEELSGDITSPKTLQSDYLYTVTSTVDIEAELTIEPGAIIQFEQGTGFTVPTVEGAIIAEGTEENPILFTSTNDQPGWWNGIYLEQSSNMNNILDYVIIEYGGGEDFRNSGSGNVVIGRQHRDASSIEITNSVIRYSGSDGIWVRSNGDLPDFGNNVMTNNDDAPVSIGSNRVHRLDINSEYTGNGDEFVYVRSGHDLDDDDVTWRNLDVPYRVRGGTVLIDGVDLTIEAGTYLEFEQGGQVRLEGHGGLIADGTETEPITFTASDPQPGWWDGIYLEESNFTNNLLNHVVVEYGGGESYRNSGSGNIVIGRQHRDDSSIEITNSIIRHSYTDGIWVRSNGDLPDFGNNVLTDNADAPVNIGSNKAHRLDSGSEYTGNGDPYVYIRGGHEIDDENVTWNLLDAPYRISSSTVTIEDVDLTIEPGTVLEFEQGGQLRLDENGGLIADGTDTEPIIFTGVQQSAGWWDGIYLEKSSNVNNLLNHVTVEYGGGNNYRNSNAGNVVVGRQYRDDSYIEITNSMIRHSDSYGIWTYGGVGEVNDDACNVNDFENNAQADCQIN